MALADTAALVASLELRDRFTQTAQRAESVLGKLEQQTGRSGRSMGLLGHTISTALGVGLERVAESGLRLLGDALRSGEQEITQLESVTVATNTVLRSTRGVAGQTAGSVRGLAEQFENLNATMDDKVIQSGENLLLTFTKIGPKAFQPALEAALNLNQALGGGEAGLQGTIVQLGKALNDPLTGLTALRRVGVSFSQAQVAQIKTLVKQNDLYGAQKIILKELATEFGGQFAAAGQTATARFARFQDTIRDLEGTLTTALVPALADLADELNSTLSDPAVQQAIAEFGKGLAGGLREAVKWAKSLDLSGVIAGLRTVGGLAKTVLDVFTKLPTQVQVGLVGAFAVNKVTGGAAFDIGGQLVGALARAGVGKAFVQPVFVTNQAAGAPVGGGGGGIRSILTFGAALGLGAIALDKFQNELVPLNDAIAKQTTDIKTAIDISLKSKSTADLQAEAAAASKGLADLANATQSLGPAQQVLYGSQFDALKKSIAAINDELEARRTARLGDERNAQAAATSFDRLEGAANPLSRTLDQLRSSSARLHDANVALFRQAAGLRGGKVSSAALSQVLQQRGPVGQSATVIAGAMTLALKQGGVGNIALGIRELRSLQARFIAQGDTRSAAKIGGDIRTLTGVLRAKRLSVQNRITIPVTATVSVRGVIAQTTSLRLYSSNQYVES